MVWWRRKRSPGVDFIATHQFVHRDAVTGEEFLWEQEDEDAVKTRADAIAMIQRTIDFWIVKLRDDLVVQRAMTLEEATETARTSFRTNVQDMISKPFPRKFGMVLDDFRFTV